MAHLFPWLILFLPLAAAILITLFLSAHRELSARLSIGAITIPFALSLLLLFGADITTRPLELTVNWLTVGGLKVDFGLRLDQLSLLMLVVVTAVGGAIHLYSYGYMRDDPDQARYFASLSFFTFSMLGVVLANNLLLMFIFWELVGISSYLLIGFWFERPAAADAAKKAFLTNRLGDTGFLLGIILLWTLLGSVHIGDLQKILTERPQALGTLSTLIGLLIFCGAVGKSAQFPLHVWLPDAMEGPTPVSALIHAATMVAAGIFMLCRVFFVFTAEPAMPALFGWLQGISALDVIAWIGLITSVLAALMAIQQDDIKRILAYSTLSQLGFMVMAVGLSGPVAAMYHLTTHAFFKALLFLGAGAVIYALHHEQDIWRMGALRRKMPITYWTFLAATLALCGVPPTSGFFSKDAILAQAYEHHTLLFILAVLSAGLTAFYMFRLIFVVFTGPAKSEAVHHANEAPAIMTRPMLFLVVPTLLLGLWGLEPYLFSALGIPHTAAHLPWYQQVLTPFAHAPLAALAGLGATGFGFFAAYEYYRQTTTDPLPQVLGGFSRLLRHRFYLDELYAKTVIRAQEWVAIIANGIDRWIIAGVGVTGTHGAIEILGRLLRLLQTGNLQTYAFLFVVGLTVVLYWLL